MIFLPATGYERRFSHSSHCDLWSPEKDQIWPKRRKFIGAKFNPSLFITLLILLSVSSVKGHLLSGDSKDQSGPSQSPGSRSESSSELVNVFPDPSSTVHPAPKKSSRGKVSLSFSSGDFADAPSASPLAAGAETGQKEILPLVILPSPNYLAISSSFGERTKTAHPEHPFTPEAAGGVKNRLTLLPPPPHPFSRAARKRKRSTPSCSTLKSLWKAGKLVTVDSIFGNEHNYRNFDPRDQFVPPPDSSTSIVTTTVASNIPQGFFGNFAPQEQQIDEKISSSFDEGYRTNQLNFQLDSKPIFQFSPDPRVEFAHSKGDEGVGDSQNTLTTDEDAPRKADDFSQASFFEGIWYNEPVKF